MKTLIFIVVGLLLPALAFAAPQPADFAYGMPLSLEESGAVYRLRLPIDVYQIVTRDDLNDIRVFNKAKAVVPFMLRRPEKKSETKEQTTKLPFFPLYRHGAGTADDSLVLHYERKKDGTILDIKSKGAQAGQDRILSGYIIDASNYDQPMDALDLFWLIPEQNFMTSVVVAHSSDLTQWKPLVHRTTLAQMHYGSQEIIQRRVTLPAKPLHYIRMLWTENANVLKLDKVVAVELSTAQTMVREWKTIDGGPASGPDDAEKKVTAYEYDSGAHLPVDRIRLRFAEKNSLLSVALFSRNDPGSPWRYLQTGIFYDLEFSHTTLLQETISIKQTSDRYWRLEIANETVGDAQIIPKVALGWLPHELLFVARGQGPFMLAYGSARLDEKERTSTVPDALAQVMATDEHLLLKEAAVRPKTVLGGPDRLTPVPPPLAWRKWLLWGVLVFGVGFIARMALSLIKAMGKEKEE
jgi:hypothetical protein